MTPKTDLVRLGLANPQTLMSLTLRDWDLLVRQARKAEVLGRIYFLLKENGLLGDVPSQPRTHLEAAGKLALSNRRIFSWEIYCIQRALSAVQTEVVLLKGSAYASAGFAFAEGRIQSDVDILVPKTKLNEVESALLEHGWESLKIEEYDQHYYRHFSHELPPLIHRDRGVVIDVHHNILPVTSRLHPDPARLLQAAEPVLGTGFKRLCATDMVLHAAAHMFQDGELERVLRELIDIDGLLRVFGAIPGFWNDLLRRAPEMDLQRPLFYALRYSRLYLQTAIPEKVLSGSMKWAPHSTLTGLMDDLVSRAIVPRHSTTATLGANAAHFLLYVRSHWLRMPPLMLTRHLLHQGLRRFHSPNRSSDL